MSVPQKGCKAAPGSIGIGRNSRVLYIHQSECVL